VPRTEPIRIAVDETVELIQAELNVHFRGTRFELSSGRKARTSWILVTWTDGPPVDAVRTVTARFDGMPFSHASGRRRRRAVSTVGADGRTLSVTYEPASVGLYRRRG
jgi:hypothetical protein